MYFARLNNTRQVIAALPILLSAGCTGNANPPASASGTPLAVTASAPQRAVAPKLFDQKLAWQHLLKQCEFGPRPVGTDAHRRTKDYLLAELAKVADRAYTQDFTYKNMPLWNIVGVFNAQAKRQVLLCAHWDTRPVADQEIDPVKRSKPILGANDGASGVAALLELARVFKQKRPDIGVVIVFFDGEDYGNFTTDQGVFLGSKYFARNHREYKIEYGILLDMVGDKDLQIDREQNSERLAKNINDKVFSAAKDLGYKQFVDFSQTFVIDDHIQLNNAGIPCIDLIDFNYGPWHTLDDVPANCSADSLGAVGATVAEVIYREKP